MTALDLGIPIGAVLLGLVVGSFLNVVAHRLPRGQSLIAPPSACPQCGHTLRTWENVPLVSYLLLGGRCRTCGEPISLAYPLTEGSTAALSGATTLVIGPSLFLAPVLLFTWWLIVLARIDIAYRILPDRLTASLGLLGLVLSIAGLGWPDLAGKEEAGLPGPLGSLFGMGVGYGLLFGVAWGYSRATGRQGLGGGDLKLLGALGAWLGPMAVLLALFLAALLGSLVGSLLFLLRGASRYLAIPFGPFLATSGWILLLWKAELIQGYLRLSGLSG